MRIRRWTVSEHCGSLARTVSNSRLRWNERAGLLLHLEDESGVVGTGEASPLPGYSPDTLDECRGALARAHLDGMSSEPRMPPAARFAFDTARLDLAARLSGVPAWQLLKSSVPGELPLAHLVLERDLGLIRERVEHAAHLGVGCFKLKVGADPTDPERCRAVRRAAPDAEIRLDANGAFAPEQAAERLRPYAEYRCSFVEEPFFGGIVGGTSRVSHCESLPVPLALDESLRHRSAPTWLGALLDRVPVGAVVLKPMLLGGLSPVERLAAVATSRAIPVIVSHLFDGPVALAACSALALAWGTQDVAMGLALHPGLEAWDGNAPHFIETSRLVAWDGAGLTT